MNIICNHLKGLRSEYESFMYYIKTKNKKHIDNFINICKECNLPFDELNDELDDNKIIGVGIYITTPECFTDTPNINDIKFDIAVCLIDENSYLVQGNWRRDTMWSLNKYENNIRNFNFNDFKLDLYNKLLETKKRFTEFKIGCNLSSRFKCLSGIRKLLNNNSDIILNYYYYCEIDKKWCLKTSAGYTTFEDEKVYK